MKITKINAVSGSGKTYQILQHIVGEVLAGQKIVLAQPIKQLISQSARDVKAMTDEFINIKVIDSDQSNYVQRDLNQFLDTQQSGWLLFITHKTLIDNEFFKNSKSWHLYIDETPTVVEEIQLLLPLKSLELTNHFTFNRSDIVAKRDFIRLEPLPTLIDISENRQHDAVFAVLQPVATKIIREDFDVFMTAEMMDKVEDKNVEDGKFYFQIRLKPSVFEKFGSVTLMSANLEDSFLFQLWKNEVEFESHLLEQQIQQRMPTHEHSDKITIKYSFQNAWSINKSKKNVIQAGVQRNSLDVFADAVITEFRDQEFIWIANNAAVSVLRSKFGDNQNISSVSHGMNNHVNTHNVAFMAALNPSPAHQRFLQSIGMTDEKIKNAKVHQNIYQAVMRTSIRNPDSTSDKTIIVPDLGSALYMQMKIPGAEIQQLDGGIEESNLVRGSKPLGDKPMTAAERQRKRRAKIKAAKSAA